MGVAKNLGDRQYSTGLKRLVALQKRCRTIRYFTKRRDHKDEIEAHFFNVGLRGITDDRGQVCDSRVLCAPPKPINHSRLNVEAYGFPTGVYSLCCRDK